MFTTIKGVKTHYQLIGQGQPLVMLHGWGCDWQIWYPLIQSLSTHYQLIIPDLPAFGQSEAAAAIWNTTDYVKWFEEFIKATLDTKPFMLMGHSFGGKIGAVYASQQPAQLQKLILVGSSGLPDPLPPHRALQQTVLGLIPTQLKNAIPAAFKYKVLNSTGSATDHFHSNPTQRQILRQIVRENIAHYLPNLTVPTLLLWGKNDPETPLNQGRRFAELTPHSTLVLLEKSGHFPFIDETETFVTQLESFLTS